MTQPVEFIGIDWNGRAVEIEYQWVGTKQSSAPVLVFLHEGIGSLAMWKDFPEQLCQAVACRGLVYSRPGYGRSTPREAGENWDVDFMHRQAYEVVPALLRALQIDPEVSPPWFFGHSDGGSIALLYAAAFPRQVAGLIVQAPHIMVEEICVDSIEKARKDYPDSDMKEKLGRYHADPDSVFWGWNDIWLRPEFRAWSIENVIGDITCPLLAVQGLDDEYGTLEQIRGIARRARQAELAELPNCGHSPHRDQPGRLIELCSRFLAQHGSEMHEDEAGFCAQY